MLASNSVGACSHNSWMPRASARSLRVLSLRLAAVARFVRSSSRPLGIKRPPTEHRTIALGLLEIEHGERIGHEPTRMMHADQRALELGCPRGVNTMAVPETKYLSDLIERHTR